MGGGVSVREINKTTVSLELGQRVRGEVNPGNGLGGGPKRVGVSVREINKTAVSLELWQRVRGEVNPGNRLGGLLMGVGLVLGKQQNCGYILTRATG